MAQEDRGMGVGLGIGLLAGAAIGIGLGLLFAPKEGAALRRDIARRARELQDEAIDQFEHAREAADKLAARGKDVADRARAAVTTGLNEARRQATAAADDGQRA